MKKFDQRKLYNELKEMNQNMLEAINYFETLSTKELQQKMSPESWSVLECMEHLNRYADFYNGEIRRVCKNSQPKEEKMFKSTWLGNYFALSVAPKQKLNKMKTFKNMNPIHSKIDREVMGRLKEFLLEMDELLDYSVKFSWTKLKTNITISKIIKLRLGDTWRVVVYHNQRHFNQMYQVVKGLGIYDNQSKVLEEQD